MRVKCLTRAEISDSTKICKSTTSQHTPTRVFVEKSHEVSDIHTHHLCSLSDIETKNAILRGTLLLLLAEMNCPHQTMRIS